MMRTERTYAYCGLYIKPRIKHKTDYFLGCFVAKFILHSIYFTSNFWF